MNYFDEWGQGINRMKTLMQENHLPEPVFSEELDEFKVILYGPGNNFMQDI
jgi:predicted HTH transcriptional regulator